MWGRLLLLIFVCPALVQCQETLRHQAEREGKVLHVNGSDEGYKDSKWTLDCEISPIEGNKLCHVSHQEFGVIEISKPLKYNIEIDPSYRSEMLKLGAIDSEGIWSGQTIRVGFNHNPTKSVALRVDKNSPHYSIRKGMIVGNEAKEILLEIINGDDVVVEYTELPENVRRNFVSLNGVANLLRSAGVWVGLGPYFISR